MRTVRTHTICIWAIIFQGKFGENIKKSDDGTLQQAWYSGHCPSSQILQPLYPQLSEDRHRPSFWKVLLQQNKLWPISKTPNKPIVNFVEKKTK